MKVEIVCLGVGSSSGTPVPGCRCPTCMSPDPRNKRLRTSALVSVDDRVRFLLDTGPDLRQQMLRADITHIDAVLYTHPHADHLHGIDDLRSLCFLKQAPIPVLGNDMMITHIEQRFSYVLASPNGMWDKPVLSVQRITDEPFIFQGVQIIPIPIMHGNWATLGFRIGNMAYITDVSFIPESSMARLQGLDVLFLSCLRPRPHHTHFNVEAALVAARRIAAGKTVFIHMTHELEYHAFSKQLAREGDIVVGYDGLVMTSG